MMAQQYRSVASRFLSQALCVAAVFGASAQAAPRPAATLQDRALLQAAQRGDLTAARTALIAGADPRTADALGVTALQQAALQGKFFDNLEVNPDDRILLQRRLDIVKLLIVHGAGVKQIIDQKKGVGLEFGDIMMLNALYEGRYDVAETLQAHGIGSKQFNLLTILSPSNLTQTEHDPLRRTLFTRLLTKPSPPPSPPLWSEKKYLTESLFDAVHLDDGVFFVKGLLTKGADVNAYNYLGSTPLIEAIRARNVPVVGFLLHHGADPDKLYSYVNKPNGYPMTVADYNGRKPLEFAAEAGDSAIISLLQEAEKSRK